MLNFKIFCLVTLVSLPAWAEEQDYLRAYGKAISSYSNQLRTSGHKMSPQEKRSAHERAFSDARSIHAADKKHTLNRLNRLRAEMKEDVLKGIKKTDTVLADAQARNSSEKGSVATKSDVDGELSFASKKAPTRATNTGEVGDSANAEAVDFGKKGRRPSSSDDDVSFSAPADGIHR